jgi:4-diphosphocytidyl-2C-methyl-D-erythritol kinase
MYLLTLKNKRDDGAYAVDDGSGSKVLFLFEEEDDAERYAMMLEDQEDNKMSIIEVDDELAIKTCRMHNYKYAVITQDDIVIPPKS